MQSKQTSALAALQEDQQAQQLQENPNDEQLDGVVDFSFEPLDPETQRYFSLIEEQTYNQQELQQVQMENSELLSALDPQGADATADALKV